MSINEQFVEDNYKLIQYMSTKVGVKLTTEDREDLVNDTVVKILEAKEMTDEHPSGYVKKVMRNCLLNTIRDNNTDALLHASISLDQATDDSDEGDGGFTYHEVIADKAVPHDSELYRGDIHDLCSQLPPRQAEIFNMRYYEGREPEEIGELLGITTQTVKNTLGDAKKNAYKIMGKEMNDV